MTESTTRQARWQRDRKAKGLCITCGQPGAVHEKGKRMGLRSQYCKKHLIARREMQRTKVANKKRYKSLSYQLEDE